MTKKMMRDGADAGSPEGVATASADGKRCAHTPGPWDAYVTDDGFSVFQTDGHGNGDHVMCVQGDPESEANARLLGAAPDLLDAAKVSDKAFTWLAEQMNSITDNAKHWNVAQIEALAQDLRIGIERNQAAVQAAILKANGLGWR